MSHTDEIAALRKVAEAARAVFDRLNLTPSTPWELHALRAALDALPAEPEAGEKVVTLGVMRGRLSGTYTGVSRPDQEDPRDWVHVCNVTFVAPPVAAVPTIPAKVEPVP